MAEVKNKIVYIDGRLYRVIRTYEGDVDLSRHGSPWYETFIEVVDLETDEVSVFSELKCRCIDALTYIKNLESKIDAIKQII